MGIAHVRPINNDALNYWWSANSNVQTEIVYLPCKLASRLPKPIDASVSNCVEYRSSGGWFEFAPDARPPIMRAINSENNAGFDWAFGVDVLVFVVVVFVVDVADVVVKPGGTGGMPNVLTRPGAAERKRSMPCWICMMASSACGLLIIDWISGFCICWINCGIIVRICSCICGLLANNGLWLISWRDGKAHNFEFNSKERVTREPCRMAENLHWPPFVDRLAWPPS